MKGRKVVVADDEAHIRHIVCVKLQNAGLEVAMAADGEEALELCLAEPPDLLITDYQMPRLSGLELCLRLRQEPRLRGIPAIMLTARGFDLSAEQTAQAGIAILMSKPFSPREVLEKATALLTERPAGGDQQSAGQNVPSNAARAGQAVGQSA